MDGVFVSIVADVGMKFESKGGKVIAFNLN